MSVNREPKGHYLSWEKDFNPEIVKDIIDLQNYDVIVNTNQDEYENDGIYIYFEKNVYNLNDYPDDYGCLPEWVELRKEDLGYSYFSEDLISHNTLTPINTSNGILFLSKLMIMNYNHFNTILKELRLK